MQLFKPMLTAICVLLPVVLVVGQDKNIPSPIQTITERELHLSPFSKGNWEFRIDRKIGYEYNNHYIEDNKQGHESNLNIDMQAVYYFMNGFGAGLEFCGDWCGEYNGVDELSRRWMTYGSVTYGRPLTDNIGIYARAGAGFGNLTEITKYQGNTVKDKHNLFGIKAEIGAPMLLNSGFSYITPYVAFNHRSTDFDNGKEKDNGIQLGFRLTTFLACDDMTCNCSKKRPLMNGRYNQGSSFIDFTTNGSFGFGKTTFDYDNMSNDYEEKFSRGSVRLHYNYYVIDNLSVGAGLRFSRRSNDQVDNDYKTTGTMWSVMPVVEYNLPFKNALNNFFVQAGVGIGSGRVKIEEENEPDDIDKNKLFNVGVGIGYNDFFANRLSFTPYIGYEWNTRKNTDTDVKQKSRGFEFGLGIRTFF
jgi:hypothetical protein